MNHTYQIAICDDESKILDDLAQRIKDAFISSLLLVFILWKLIVFVRFFIGICVRELV